MDVELLTIGTELLLGFTLDSNAAFLGRSLAEAGVRVTRRTTVDDRPDRISGAVREALGRTRFVITSGGLGPTHDDVTKRAIADLFDAPLEFDPAVWEGLVTRFARLGRTLAERNRCQAEVPRGATVIPNPRGTAPGLWLRGEPGEVILLPGVPHELQGLVQEEVVPRLRERSHGGIVRSLVLRTTGLAESRLAERLVPIEAELDPLTFASLPGLLGVDLRVTAWSLPPEEADRRLDRVGNRIRELLGEHVYGTDDTDLAAELLSECRRGGLRLATAESCTGGMLGQRITAIPGSSEVFLGGVIAYANRLKEDLGVPRRILERGGAVSAETAGAMAEAARERFGADLALSVTGIAGPSGGSPDKPVGLVYFGVAGPFERVTFRMVFPGSREDIRTRACQFVLWKAWQKLGARELGG